MNRDRRHKRIRARVAGTAARPRLAVFRSNKFIYAQVIDDGRGVTLAAARGELKKAESIGSEVAKRAIAKKIKKVVFDRGGFLYSGKIKKLAEGARAGGLQF